MRFAFNLAEVDIEILEFLKFQNFAHPVFQYPDSPATVCLDTQPITVKADEKNQTCSQSTSMISGIMDGTSGTVSLSVQTGFSTIGSWTVQRKSSGHCNIFQIFDGILPHYRRKFFGSRCIARGHH